MAFIKISGEVSDFQQGTVITGTQSNRSTGMGQVHSHNEINFRINNKPTTLRLKTTVHLTDGENVTAVGKEKNGVFQASIIRNDNTGVTYSNSIWPLIIFGCLFTLPGLIIMNQSWVFGIILIALFSPWFFYGAYNNFKAKEMIEYS